MSLPLKILYLGIVTALVCAGTLLGTEPAVLGAPPEGFTWKQLTEIKAAFLVPNGWHFKHETNTDNEAYFVTLEDIDKQGSYLTGMSVNTVPNVSKKTNTWAKNYALLVHKQIKADSTITLVSEWENPQPPFMLYGLKCEKKVEGGLTIVMHQLIVANEKTDRLYVILFESTKEFWDAAWRIGDVMMTKFVLDEGV